MQYFTSRLLGLMKRLVLGILLSLVLYLLAAWVFSLIVLEPEHGKQGDIEVWLRSNGVHVDIVVPTTSETFDWRSVVPPSDTRAGFNDFQWLAFGWGDRGFYLNTPEWKDLRFSTAFNAAFGLGASAMHTTYHAHMHANERNHRFLVSSENYASLCAFLQSGFECDDTGAFQVIGGHARYGQHDAFYAGTGRYSAFKTCNTWTNNALKAAKLPHCFWTPFESALMRVGRKHGLTSDSVRTEVYQSHRQNR